MTYGEFKDLFRKLPEPILERYNIRGLDASLKGAFFDKKKTFS